MIGNRAKFLLLRIVSLAGLISLSAISHGGDVSADSVTPLVQQMAGTWKVESRMWPGPDAKPIDLPPALARREIVGGAYLQEVMKPAIESAQGSFTRVAYFSYNSINQQYEYFSLDSRLPQMMSYAVPGANRTRGEHVELAGASFVAPEWGNRKNVPFMYRLVIGAVQGNRQVIELFLNEQGTPSGEFLAFQYVYTLEQ